MRHCKTKRSNRQAEIVVRLAPLYEALHSAHNRRCVEVHARRNEGDPTPIELALARNVRRALARLNAEFVALGLSDAM